MPGHVVVWHASCLFSALLQFSWSIYLLCSLLDLYCTLEVDSYGYFVSKAKTRVFRDTAEPQWNEVSQPRLFLLLHNAAFWSHKYLILLLCLCVFEQEFEIELEGSQYLRILCYEKCYDKSMLNKDDNEIVDKIMGKGQVQVRGRQHKERRLCPLGDVSQHVTHFN